MKEILALALLMGLTVLALPEPSEPKTGGDPNVVAPQCQGAFVEQVEVMAESPQRVERVRMVTLCKTSSYYRLLRVYAMRVDGRLGQPFSNGQETLCEPSAPEPERTVLPDVLRGP